MIDLGVYSGFVLFFQMPWTMTALRQERGDSLPGEGLASPAGGVRVCIEDPGVGRERTGDVETSPDIVTK